MNNVAVIGLNSIGKQIARELSLAGFSVCAIDRPSSKNAKFEQKIQELVLIEESVILKLKETAFEKFKVTILLMSECAELALKSLLYLQSQNIENVVICTENDEQQMIAELFTHHKGWHILRLDKQAGSHVKNVVEGF